MTGEETKETTGVYLSFPLEVTERLEFLSSTVNTVCFFLRVHRTTRDSVRNTRSQRTRYCTCIHESTVLPFHYSLQRSSVRSVRKDPDCFPTKVLVGSGLQDGFVSGLRSYPFSDQD